MIKKYFCLWYLLLMYSACVYLYAERWPVSKDSINQIYQQYQSEYDYDIFTLHFEYSGKIFAIADAVVYVVQSEKYVQSVLSEGIVEDSTFPHMITLATDDGFHVSYYGIVSSLKIGDIVRKGEPIGERYGHWYMRVFDTIKKRWVDPLALFPDIDRSIRISIEEFAFYYPNGMLINTKRIMSGIANIRLVLHISDYGSVGYILPYYIQVSLGDTKIVLTQKDILARIDNDYLSKYNKISLLLEDIQITNGFHIMKIIVRTPLSGYRKFKFSMFAASKN